ncbi:hypothetical protein KUCAC02_035499, partial [Chaenocephalus aceratus]
MQPVGSEEWVVAATTKTCEGTVLGLSAGHEYLFRVTAFNEKGKSDPRPFAAPVTAKDVTVLPGFTMSTDTFSLQTGEDLKIEIPVIGRPAPKVEWSKDGKALKETTRLNVTSTPTYTKLCIKEANREDSGKYTITATSSLGTATEEMTVVILEKPGPPTGPVKVEEVSSNYVLISWEPPVYTGGCQINNYIVEKKDTTTTAWQIVSATIARSTIKVTNLKTGIEYQFRVSAENRYGKSSAILSPNVIAQYPFSEPAAPGTPVISAATKDNMVVEWKAPTDDGGSPILGYHLERKEKNSLLWTKLNKLLIADTRFKTTELEEGIEYEFKVYAENIAGVSPASKVSECTVARDPCDPPGTPEAIDITRNHVALQWTRPQYDGGSAITGYFIERRKHPDTRWMKASFTNIIETNYIITGLTEDCVYEFRVVARNAAGIYSRPSESTGEITAKDEIEAPEAILDSKFKDLTVVRAGETFIIDADYTGKPLPEISWLKEGKEIDQTTPRMEVKTTITRTTLTVKECIRVDGGHFVLKLVNVGGVKMIPVNVKVLDRPGPPDGPLEVKGVTSEKCYLHWSHPSHDGGASISHYIIEKRETSRLSWTMVEPMIQAISYKVTKLLPGNEYIFRVTAVNKYGIGDPLESAPVIARNPFTTPSAPSTPEPSVIARDSIVLTWERPEDNGGSEIDGYVLEKRDKDGIRWTKCNKKRLTDLRFRCSGLGEGHSYEFRVSAENAAGVGKPSAPSEYIKACDAIYPPGCPNNPKVTDNSSTTVSLSWFRPIYDGGAQISGYVVEMKEAADDEWVTSTPHSGVQATSFTVKHLKENAEYNFRICAVNCEGVGEHVDLPGSVVAAEKLEAPEIELDADLRKMVNVRATANLRLFVPIRGKPEPEVKWSKADGVLNERAQIDVTSSYTMLMIENVDRFDTGKYVLTLENLSGSKSAFINVRVLDSPSAPTNLGVKDVKRNSVSISWEPPLIDGGAKISHYIVEKREQKRMAFTSICTNCVRNSYLIPDLQEGGRYYFRVLAVNELGVGLPASTDQVKVAEAPLPPGKIVLVDVTRHTVTLSWEKPDHDGGSKITSFMVEMQPKGDDKWTLCSEAKALEATIGGLTTGEEYSFRVTAVNDKGKSDAKPLASPVLLKDMTTKPFISQLYDTYSVRAGDDLKIDVPFRGRPQPEVSWKKDGHVLKQTTRVNVLNSKTSSKITIKDATKEDVGKYEITLTNSVGTKTAETSVVILDKPGPPSNIKFEEVSADFINLSWDAPTYDGGCQINNYVVEKKDTTTIAWQIVSATVARTSIKVNRLNQGTEYQFRIAAENRYGKSSAIDSAPVVAQYPFEPPGTPTNVRVSHATKYGMLVEWGRPASDGGSPVTGYHIECKDQSSILWTKVNRGLLAENQFKMTGIEEGLFYQFRVYAENMAGIGSCTKACEPVAARDPCESPHNLRVTNITRTSVSLFWEKPEYDGGVKITGYIVERRELPNGRWLKCNFTNLQDTYFDVTGLTEDVQYDFHVIAKNSAELLSDPCESTGPVTVKDDVDPPTITLEDKLTQLVVVKAGDIIRIDAEISGRPLPVVTWCKDGKEIEAKARCEITSTNFATTLIVRDAIRRDSGQYVLSLHNVAGTRAVAINFKVLDIPGPASGPLSVSGLTAEKCTIMWGPPQENGGAEIMHYIVEKRETSRLAWTLVYADMKATTCKVTKLLRGNEYIFRVRGVNKYGDGEPMESEPTKAIDPFTVSAAPTNVQVTSVTSEAMTICWERPTSDGGSSISGYVIEKREKTGLRWCRVNKKPVYDLRVKAGNLRNGCEYEYRVFAENSAGLSASSTTCPLTKAEDPQFLPSPPAKPKIIDSSKTTVTLSWNKPLFDGGAPVTGYKVKYRKSSDDEWMVGVHNTKNTEFSVGGLTPGTEYVFVVKSMNKIGASENSAETDAQVAKEREEEPVFDISNEMRKTLIVKDGSSFTMKVPFRGKPIPSVSWSKADVDLRVRAVIDTTDTFTSITLEKATRYDSGKYVITLSSVSGTASLTLNVRVLDSPGPPCHLEVKDVTRTSASVTWDTPENEGGGPVKNYLVDFREASKKGWTRLTDTCHRLTYKVSDMLEGGVFYFRVTGENDYGVGVSAETKDGTKITEKPSPPAKLGATDVTKESVALAWAKPDHDGGSRITGYLLEALEKGQEKWVKCGVTKSVHFTVFGLRENAEYFFRVRAENHAGFSDIKEMLTPVLLKDQLESPEMNMNDFPHNTVYVRAGSNLKCEIPLTGRPLPKVSLSKDNVLLKSTMRFNSEVTPDSIKVTLRESIAGDSGRYDIIASNSNGTTTSFLNIVVLDRPSAPIGPVQMFDITEDSVSLEWLPPAYEGGSPITNYVILKKEVTSANWVEVSSAVARCTMKIMKLTTGLAYQFRVRAENKYGISEHIDSETVAVNLPYTVPEAPSTPEITAVTKETVTVAWNEPKSDGGSHVFGYHLQMKDRNSILWQKVNKMVIRAAHYKVTDISAGLIYEFKVAAENAAGNSPFSQVSDAVLAIDACEPPINLRISDITKHSISLAWHKPNYDGGSSINGYVIEKKEGANARWSKANLINVTDTRYTVTGLTQDETYEFRVMAKNAVGSVSNPSTVVGPATCVDTYGAPEIEIPQEYFSEVKYRAESSVELTFNIIAKPAPTIEWFKDGRELAPSSQLAFKHTFESTSLFLNDTTRLNSGTYEVRVKNSMGSASAIVRLLIQDKPGPPDGEIEFKKVTANTATIMWSPPSDEGGAMKLVDCIVNVPRLIEGNEYIFRVRGVNKYGIGDALESEPIVAKNAFVPPSEPSKPKVTIITKSTMTVLWERPAVDGGSDIDGYYLEKREKKSLQWFKVVKGTIRDTRQKVTNLTENNEYQYRVCAVNKAGAGNYSEGSDLYKAYDPIDLPGEPSKLRVVDSTKSSITLGWEKPVYDGGSEVTHYLLEMLNSEEKEWAIVNPQVKACEYVVSHLKPGAYYFFRVSAVNCKGKGEDIKMYQPLQAKDILEEADLDLDVPMTTQYTARAGRDVEVFIPLKGRPAPNVTWRRGDRNIAADNRYTITSTERATTLLIPKVSRDDRGKYLLEIENGVGEPKIVIVSLKVLDSPAICQKLMIKNVTRGNLSLSWEAPLIEGGSPVTHYVVEKKASTMKAYHVINAECTNTTYKVTGLEEDTAYFFRVSAENEYGVGETCETTEPVRATETPGAVKNLVMADSTKTSVTLQWTRPDHDGGSYITEYIVEKRSIEDPTWTLGATCKRLSCEVTGLTEKAEMDFRVLAKNEKGNSDFSQIGPITVKDFIILPEANMVDYPNGELAVRVGQNIHIELPFKGKPLPSISWLKDNQPLKESDKVRFRTTDNKTAVTVRGVKKENAGQYTLCLDNRTVKNYFDINVITLGPPSVPVGPIRFDEIKAQSIIISWDEPKENGGGEITCYSVEKRETAQANWKMVCSSVVRPTFKIPNLVKGTQYQFRVRAENKFGISVSLASAEVVAQHQYKPPGPPPKPVAFNVTCDGMTIRWDAPEFDGGSPILGYHVEKKDRNSLLWQKVNSTIISNKEYRITGLIEGLEYSFRVCAENNAGLSPASEQSKHALAIAPVDPPGKPVCIDVTRDSVTLKWDVPERDGGSKIVGYSVERRQGRGKWLRCNFTDVCETQLTVTSLSSGDRFEFRVIARNAVATVSPPSNSSGYIMTKDESISPDIEWSADQALTLKAGENVKLSCSIVGRPVPQVIWYKNGKEIDKRTMYDVEITSDIGTSSLFIRDADRDHRGIYTIEAKNSSGSKTADANVRVQDTPGPVEGPIRFTGITAEKCTVWWNPPENDGCAAITHYVVEKRETSRISWAMITSKCEACSYNAVNLIKGNEYQFRISAVNKSGVGKPLDSDPFVAQMQYTVPDAPGTPDATHVTGNSITMCWTRPRSDGGNEIKQYILERREKKSLRWLKVSSKRTITELRHRVTNLTEGNEYEFRVMAENGAGIGPASSTSRLIKCREPTSAPSSPTLIKVADSTKNSVTLEWTKPVFDGGLEVIGYNIDMCKASLEEWHRVNSQICIHTSYTAKGLVPGELYKFRVSALNGAGEGESSGLPNAVQALDRLRSPEIELDASFKQTHIVKNGSTVTLHVPFRGKPVPLATWSRVDGELPVMADVNTTECSSILTIESCTRYEAGKYTLSLENNSGRKSITFTVKVQDTPGPPGAITFKDVTRGALTVMWDAPANDGGARVHHYIVDKREASRLAWQEVSSKSSRQMIRVTDLDVGIPYVFRVIAVNQYGQGEPFEMTEPVMATEEPAPPRRLDVVDTTNSTASLVWLKPEHDGGSRIRGYVVEFKAKGSDHWNVGGETRSMKMLLEGLIENTEYDFRVSAKNDAGTSEPQGTFSSVVIKEPRIEPTADLSSITNQLVTCKISNNFTISIPISGRPAPKVTWKLEEMKLKESDRVCITTTKEITTLTVRDSKRSDSGKYYLILENVAGVKTFTVTVVVVGRPTPPAGPVVISEVSSESCSLSWSEPADDGGTEIGNYIVEKRESGSASWQVVNSSVKRTTIKVTNLTKYMEYTFRVCAENKFGVSKSTESAAVVIEHPFVPPSPPTRPDVVSVSANAIGIKWDLPYDDGGSKVTGYWIEKKERNTILWVRENKLPCLECHYKVSNLIEGLEYQFRAYAMNISGFSKAGEASRPVVALNPVDPPGKPEVTDITRNSVSLCWTIPSNDGGSKIVGYVVERKVHSTDEWDDNRWLKCNYTTISENYFTVTNLGEGETFEYRVIAKNAAGVHSAASEITGPVTCKDEYSPPKAELDSKLVGETVIINAGSDLVLDGAVGGKPEPTVFWSKGEKMLELGEKYSLTYTATRAMAVVKSCDRYDTGRYVLTAKNANGLKTAVVNVKVLDTPGAPAESVTISRVTEEKCSVSWKIPLEDGGDIVTHYIVERRETSRLNWVLMETECKTLACVSSHLIKNNEYVFRVRGVNKFGVGVPLESEPVRARNAYTITSQPGTPEVMAVAKEHVVIEWLKPETDGGSEIKTYLVDKREKSSTRWTRVNKNYTIYDTRLKIAGLLEGSEYQFRVTAVNAAGDSTPSDASPYILCKDPTYTPATPSMPRITDTTKHSISMKWTRPMYDGGSDVSGYVVEILEEGTEQWYRATAKALKTNEYVAAGLASNKRYRFRVAAINSKGTGEFSEASAEVEPLERIEVPDLELSDDLKKTVCLRAGGTLRLVVFVNGRPAPVISWRKTGVELQNRGHIENTESYTALTVEKVNRYDSGKYIVEAENPSGKKSVVVLVKVYDTPGPPTSVNVKDYTKESVVITWDVPSRDGGAHVSNYIVEKREASMKSYKTVTTECRKTLLRITGVEEGVHYFFRVLPENIYGVGEACETLEAVLVCEVPSVPLDLQLVNVTKSSATLRWERPLHDGGSRINGFSIEACKVGSERWTAVASVKASASQHTVTALTENDQYLFRVRATNSRGASEPMDTVTPVTIQDIKVMPKIDMTSIPQKIVYVHRGKPIELNLPVVAQPLPVCSWSFSGEKLKDSLDRIKIDGSRLTVRDTTINDTGDYALEVKNALGKAREVIKVIILDKPGVPVGPVRIEEVDGLSVTTSWDPPEKDGGANVTGYVVEQRDAHRPGWFTVSESVTRPCYKFSRLSEGTEYVFRVAAMNRFGVGRFLQSEVVENKSPKTIPGAPSQPEVLDVTHEGMTLTWFAPEDNGGSTIAGYIIERKEAQSERWMKISKNPVTMTRFRSSALIEGQEYEHRVTAINSRGEGKHSEASEITVAMDPIDPPGAPLRPTVTDTTRSSVSLAWQPPEEEGGAAVTGYFIEMQKVDQVEWTLCNTTLTKICEYTLTHMPQSAEYKFRVIACNPGGTGEAAEVPGVVKVQEMLGYPDCELDAKYEEGYVVRQGGVIRLSVPIRGKPIPSCKWTKDGRDIAHRAMIASNDEVTELVIKEAHKDDTGSYDLVLENKCGKKAVYIKVKVIGRPDVPEGPLEYDDIQVRSVRVSWRPPSDDGGSDILGYVVERREVPKAAWCTVDSRVTETSLVVKGLKENVQYHFRISAENQFGISRCLKSEEAVTPKTPLCPPEPPSNPPEIMEVTKTTVALSWSRPRDDGGSRVTGYYVERREVSTEKWVRHNKTHITTTMYNVSGLIPDAEYMFRVVAQNDIGKSEAGPPSESVICKDPF